MSTALMDFTGRLTKSSTPVPAVSLTPRIVLPDRHMTTKTEEKNAYMTATTHQFSHKRQIIRIYLLKFGARKTRTTIPYHILSS